MMQIAQFIAAEFVLAALLAGTIGTIGLGVWAFCRGIRMIMEL